MRDFNEAVDEYKESPAQRETMFVDCDVFESVLEDSLENSWGSDNVEETGLVCGERKITVYVKVKRVWLIIELWQKTSGEADFAVYDFSVGPHSLHDFTGGLISEKISEGISDAFELFSGDNFPGRRVEEIYIMEEGLRIIGVK